MRGKRLPIIRAAVAVMLLVPGGIRSSVGLDEEEVVFRVRADSTAQVYVVGDFNGWNPTIDKMIPGTDGFELRLYLLPGRYRYRFIIDGVQKSDPDNVHIDRDGNSYFFLVERAGEFSISFAPPAARAGPSADYAVDGEGEVYLASGQDGAILFSQGLLRGTIGERAYIEAKAGWEFAASETIWTGSAYNLRGTAGYDTGKGTIRGFSRTADLELGDPNPIIGRVGPFDYPLRLFCRGVDFTGAPLLKIDTRLLYVSRIDGYRSGLEADPGAEPDDLFAIRDLTDSDIFALGLGRKFDRLSIGYVYRFDRRRAGAWWRIPGAGDTLFRGHEKLRAGGFYLSVRGSAGMTFDVEYVSGGSYLETREMKEPDEGEYETYVAEYEWEHGYRFFGGLTYEGETFGFSVRLVQDALLGERAFREGRSDGYRTVFGGGIDYRRGNVRVSLADRVETFSAENTGEIFWLQRKNYWLDGDQLTSSYLPFLGARTVHELTFGFEIAAGDDGIAYPYTHDLGLSLRYRAEQGGAARFTEVLFRKGFPLPRRITLLFDMRFASYDHELWKGQSEFFDVFTALHAQLADGVWCALGVGVSPYYFDRWRYGFSEFGREAYLLDRGLFELVGAVDAGTLLEALRNAEEELAGETMLTFEVGVRF